MEEACEIFAMVNMMDRCLYRHEFFEYIRSTFPMEGQVDDEEEWLDRAVYYLYEHVKEKYHYSNLHHALLKSHQHVSRSIMMVTMFDRNTTTTTTTTTTTMTLLLVESGR